MLNFIACLLLSVAPSTYNIDTGWRLANIGAESQISHPLAIPLPLPGTTEVESELKYEYRHVGTITNHSTNATLFINIGGTMFYTLSHNSNELNTFDNAQGGGSGPLLVVHPGETLNFTTFPATYAAIPSTYDEAPWSIPMGLRRLHKFYLTPHYFSTPYQIEWVGGVPQYSGHYPFSLSYITEARVFGTITYQ